MSEARFNAIAILDAIPDGELNTARRLRDDLKDIAYNTADGLHVRYARVETIDALAAAISALLEEARSKDLRPWLHLEGHGYSNESGFEVANGVFCSWTHLKDFITPLNVATGLNLVLVLATCFGGSFARAIRTTDRAPVLGLIGPKSSVTVGQIINGFPAFYGSLLGSSSLKEAIKALNASAPNLYYRTTAEQFFYETWATYKITVCSDKALDDRARRMYREIKSKHLQITPSIGHLKRKLRSEEPNQFEKFRDTYFMYDLDDSNRIRFPVTHEKAEAYTAIRRT